MPTQTIRFVQAAHAQYGTYHWRDWPAFYERVGLTYSFAPMPVEMDGFIYDTTVFFRDGLSDTDLALAAWHEVGHYLMHDGGVEYWSRLPQGDVTIAKYERQARAFAAMFPVWDCEGE